MTQEPLELILIPDFSNGGDVIIANETVSNIEALKGKKIGTEIGSLGMFVLHAALAKHGMTLDDVEVVNVEQLDAEREMKNKAIDAVVTYPPYSLTIAKLSGHKQVFDSAEIPGKVIDTISMRQGVVEDVEQWVEKFHKVWARTLAYARQNRDEAYRIMATREGISVEEFSDALTGLKVVPALDQKALLQSKALKTNIKEVCEVLKRAESISFECDNIHQLVHGYRQKQ